MKFHYIEEPVLEFSQGQHICPRKGITDFKVFDENNKSRRKELNIGIVSPVDIYNKTTDWIEKCTTIIPAKESAHQNLFTGFCGFNSSSGFCTDIIHDSSISNKITNNELRDILSSKLKRELKVKSAVNLYYDKIKQIIHNKNVDVVVVVIPKSFDEKIVKRVENKLEPQINEKEEVDLEADFRRGLKAKSLILGRPLQLIKEHSLTKTKIVQEDATRAWNFSTALYYKSNGIPWRLPKKNDEINTCFLGISFFSSRDRQSIQTSTAQLFDELGRGIVLRGSKVEEKEDKRPHLNEEQSYDLTLSSLKKYKQTHKNLPARLIIHKSSAFSNEECIGIQKAKDEMGVSLLDLIHIVDSDIRLFRQELYPPNRGTSIQLNPSTFLLYTRGSVEYYETYPGMYIPQPIEIRLHKYDEDPIKIISEVLALTKMNWNNTQIDGKYPITISSAREVGKILKYLEETEEYQTRYSFYM